MQSRAVIPDDRVMLRNARQPARLRCSLRTFATQCTDKAHRMTMGICIARGDSMVRGNRMAMGYGMAEDGYLSRSRRYESDFWGGGVAGTGQ
jgi:hypothetical protein